MAHVTSVPDEVSDIEIDSDGDGVPVGEGSKLDQAELFDEEVGPPAANERQGEGCW